MYAETSLKLADELHSVIGKARALLILARVETTNKAWLNAERNFKDAIRIFEELEQLFELAKTYYFYSQLKRATNDAKREGEYIKKAKEIFEKLGAKAWLKKIPKALT